jgi:hypothetical protein
MDAYYVDGVTHYGYVPSDTAQGYAELRRFHYANAALPRRGVSDARMNFERELDIPPTMPMSRYEAVWLTRQAKRIYDYPNKKLDITTLYRGLT